MEKNRETCKNICDDCETYLLYYEDGRKEKYIPIICNPDQQESADIDTIDLLEYNISDDLDIYDQRLIKTFIANGLLDKKYVKYISGIDRDFFEDIDDFNNVIEFVKTSTDLRNMPYMFGTEELNKKYYRGPYINKLMKTNEESRQLVARSKIPEDIITDIDKSISLLSDGAIEKYERLVCRCRTKYTKNETVASYNKDVEYSFYSEYIDNKHDMKAFRKMLKSSLNNLKAIELYYDLKAIREVFSVMPNTRALDEDDTIILNIIESVYSAEQLLSELEENVNNLERFIFMHGGDAYDDQYNAYMLTVVDNNHRYKYIPIIHMPNRSNSIDINTIDISDYGCYGHHITKREHRLIKAFIAEGLLDEEYAYRITYFEEFDQDDIIEYYGYRRNCKEFIEYMKCKKTPKYIFGTKALNEKYNKSL